MLNSAQVGEQDCSLVASRRYLCWLSTQLSQRILELVVLCALWDMSDRTIQHRDVQSLLARKLSQRVKRHELLGELGEAKQERVRLGEVPDGLGLGDGGRWGARRIGCTCVWRGSER